LADSWARGLPPAVIHWYPASATKKAHTIARR
jgi:hypothetical protein